MAENQGEKEDPQENFLFNPAGEAIGYISLAQARVLAMRTARETPGNYGTRLRDVPMAFEVADADDTEDYYVITLSFLPQGQISGTPGQERFFIEKEGPVADRQVIAFPRNTSTGDAVGPISLDEARLIAIQYARTKRTFHGLLLWRRNVAYQVLNDEERENFYDIRLPFRPSARYRGTAGVEQILIDRNGKVSLRQILDAATPSPEQRSKVRRQMIWLSLLVVLVTGLVGGGAVYVLNPIIISNLMQFGNALNAQPVQAPALTQTPNPTLTSLPAVRPTSEPAVVPTTQLTASAGTEPAPHSEPGPSPTPLMSPTPTYTPILTAVVPKPTVIVCGRAPEGTIVSAWIDGQLAAQSAIENGLYKIRVNQGSSVLSGKNVYFRVGAVEADQTALWTSGAVDEVNLTATSAEGAFATPRHIETLSLNKPEIRPPVSPHVFVGWVTLICKKGPGSG